MSILAPTRIRIALSPALILLLLAAAALPAVAGAAGVTSRVSVSSAGVQGNGSNGTTLVTSISADGRFVTFNSTASNLVAGDSNAVGDVFVHDRQSGATTRVSVDSAGNQANGVSTRPAISADGRFLAFESAASNLVDGDTNGVADVFVHDLQTGTTTRVSLTNTGEQANGQSFGSTAGPDLALSADGRFIAFQSRATNLVAGDTNNQLDVFVRDRTALTTTRVSVSSGGAQSGPPIPVIDASPAISADGRFVAFTSGASNLVAGRHQRQGGSVCP